MTRSGNETPCAPQTLHPSLTPRFPRANIHGAVRRERLHIPQDGAPGEHSAQHCHHPARGIIGPSGFYLPFLKQGQLLPEEEILGYKRAARPEPGRDKTTEIQKHDHRSTQAVPKSGEPNQPSGHDAQDRTLRGRYKMLRILRQRFCGPQHFTVTGHGIKKRKTSVLLTKESRSEFREVKRLPVVRY